MIGRIFSWRGFDMRARFVSVLAIVGVISLGACGTFGQKVELSLADLQTRCDARGGQLAPTGRQTAEARRDFTCIEGVQAAYAGALVNTQRNIAVDQTLRRGF
jgi:hypothetical protein